VVLHADWTPLEHDAPSEPVSLGHSECGAFGTQCILDEYGLIIASLGLIASHWPISIAILVCHGYQIII
jgi:hypothetical protein